MLVPQNNISSQLNNVDGFLKKVNQMLNIELNFIEPKTKFNIFNK